MRRERNDRRCADTATALTEWRQALWSRRSFLLRMAGGSVLALFGRGTLAEEAETLDEARRWELLDAVQQHLFPSEADSPGAREINALAYLRFVVGDPKVDAEDRQFILEGAGWLEEIARDSAGQSFLGLNQDQREQVLRRIAGTPAGENWLSTLILYLMEALLTDPVYGGNPDGVGWRWLQHIPGYPRPPKDKTYPRLLS